VLRDDRNAGGCFRIRLPGKERIYRVSDSLGNIGVQLFGFALGDHGIFCRRRAFFDAGQFPDVPLMEDAELYRALWRSGRMRQLSAAITGNQRRYEELGLYRTTAYYILILGLYLAGARISTLMAAYRRLNRDGHAKVPQPYSTSLAGLDSVTALSRSTTAPLGLRQ
jgi:hypothetical protein